MVLSVEIAVSFALSAVSAFVAIKVSLTRFEVKMQEIERRINKIDDLKLEAKLAKIETDVKYIRALLEKK